MKLSVVIVSYNVRDYLENCLQSVSRALEGIEGEVFVVDNHSDDDSVEAVRSQYPWVRLIENQENMGFSRANNIAIREARGEYVLLLNPDTIVEEATLREVLRFMEEHPKAGGAGVMMHNADGSLAPESRRALPTPWVSCLKMLGFTKRYYMSHLPWDQPSRIEVISGAFCFLRKKALDEVGLLDEDFFMYGEDIDLSYRLMKGGWENWYLPLQGEVDPKERLSLRSHLLQGHADLLPQALQSSEPVLCLASQDGHLLPCCYCIDRHPT